MNDPKCSASNRKDWTMARLEMRIIHHFYPDEAVDRIKPLLENLRAEYGDKIAGLKEKWDGNTNSFQFSVSGYEVSGTLTVEQSSVKLSGNLPWQAAIFKRKIEAAIRERAAIFLA